MHILWFIYLYALTQYLNIHPDTREFQMALIATINGKQVFSDKQVARVVNTRVTFTDGSWCDVSTGEVNNAGSGFINIGGSDSSGDVKRVSEGPKRVSASALEVRGIVADVQVDTHHSNVIEYTITGPAD